MLLGGYTHIKESGGGGGDYVWRCTYFSSVMPKGDLTDSLARPMRKEQKKKNFIFTSGWGVEDVV